MNSYKKFTDALALIAAFVAFVYIFIAFKNFKPYENEAGEIVKFWQDKDSIPYFKIFFLFLITGAAGLAIDKLPAIPLALSFFPLWYSIKFYYLREITKKPMLFIIVAMICVAGNIIDNIEFFKKERLE